MGIWHGDLDCAQYKTSRHRPCGTTMAMCGSDDILAQYNRYFRHASATLPRLKSAKTETVPSVSMQHNRRRHDFNKQICFLAHSGCLYYFPRYSKVWLTKSFIAHIHSTVSKNHTTLLFTSHQSQGQLFSHRSGFLSSEASHHRKSVSSSTIKPQLQIMPLCPFPTCHEQKGAMSDSISQEVKYILEF